MSFFVAGGTVPPGSPSYVERSADRELYEALLAGEYCYVLNSRQMGKSSLAVRTIAKLEVAGVRTAFVDLTKIGGTTSTPEQWYAGLLLETGRAFGLRSEAAAWLRDHRDLGPAQRLLSFLQETVPAQVEGPLVLMVDEIDAVRSLPFSTDEFFAGLRQFHNGRASDPALGRLTVCLLGAALPSDLIRDPRTTPFNVGRRIELRDFTADEAKPFAAVVGGEALRKVLHWTGGHPFLTQSLCAELQNGSDPEGLVRARYLDARARETDTNLADVGRRLLGSGDPNVGDRERADTLSLYERMLKGKAVADDEANPSAARIKMSGVARLENGRLTVRNEIYRRVFGPEWIRENMPGQELRRQRRAFWRGVVRTGAIAGAVVAMVGTLAWIAVRNERRATKAEAIAKTAEVLAKTERDTARYDAYVATLRNMAPLYDQRNLTLMNQALEKVKDNPARGWEWGYWHRVANHRVRRIELGWGGINVVASLHRNYAASWSPAYIEIADLRKGTVRKAKSEVGNVDRYCFDQEERKLFLFDGDNRFRIYDLRQDRVVREGKLPGVRGSFDTRAVDPDGRTMFVVMDDGGIGVVDLTTLKVRQVRPGTEAALWVNVLPDRRHAMVVRTAHQVPQGRISVYDTETWEETGHYDSKAGFGGYSCSSDGRYIVAGDAVGNVSLLDSVTAEPYWCKRLSDVAIQDPVFSPDGKLILYATRDRQSVIRPIDERGPGPVIRRIPEALGNGFMEDGRHFFTSYWHIDIHDLKQASAVPERTFGRMLGEAGISREGSITAVTGEENLALDIHAPTRPPKRVPNADGTNFDTTFRYVLRPGAKVRAVVDLETGRKLALLPSVPVSQNGLAVSADEKSFALIRRGRVIELYDVSRRCLKTLEWSELISFMRFTPDGRLLVQTAKQLELWSSDGEKRIWAAVVDRINGITVAFSPNGKRLVLVGHDDGGHIVDMETGKMLADLYGHSQSVVAVDWSPDGKRIVTGSDDRTVRLWDAATGAELGILGSHDASLVEVHFLTGGGTIASVSRDGVVKLWQTEVTK